MEETEIILEIENNKEQEIIILEEEIKEIKPPLENLEVTPSAVEQNFKSELYGYNNVKVKAVEADELIVIPTTEIQTKEGLYNKVIVNAIESEELSVTPSVEDQVNEGLYNKVTVKGDNNLIADNIKSGVSIFGVNGNNKSLDTSDATATSNDLVRNKTAYVNGEKIVGNVTTAESGELASFLSNDTTIFGENNIALIADFSSVSNQMFKSGSKARIGILKVPLINYMGLSPEKIVFGNTILGVVGTASVADLEITDGYQLFANDHRIENLMDFFPFMQNIITMRSMFNNSVSVTTLSLNQLNTSKVTDMGGTFSGCSALKNANINKWDASKVTNISQMFYGCTNLVNVDLSKLNAISITHCRQMFYNCQKITNLDMDSWDFGNVVECYDMFRNCNALQELKGLKNLGKAFTQKTTNYSNYTLSLTHSTKLSHDSLMNIINNLYDLNLSYDVANGGTLYTQSLILGSTNLAKLSAEEIAIATNKGWTVS